MQPHGADLAERLRHQAEACRRLGSPLYAGLLDRAADDWAAGGPLRDLLRGYEEVPGWMAVPLRLAGAVHRGVLAGRYPELAALYAAGDGAAAWPEFRRVCRDDAAWLRPLLERPVQTNEAGRSAALLGGFLEVARRFGLPLRCLEVGASAGLNLRWDHYRGAPWLAGLYEVPPPHLDAPVEVAERRGCDPEPLDPTTVEGALTLRSYLWPDVRWRAEIMDWALEVCRRVPAAVDRADGGEWLEARLRAPRRGVATVVFHSVVMQYPAAASLRRMGAALQAAAARATAEAPLAWLRMEPGPRTMEVRLSCWPGGGDERIAVTWPHGNRVKWLLPMLA